MLLTLWLIFAPSNYANADEIPLASEQVVVSPAQQAVNNALATATTEVQQAATATNNSVIEISQAQTELSQAQAATSTLSSEISTAQTEVNNVQTAINTINTIDLVVTPVDQSSQVVQDAKDTVIDAQTAINSINTATAQAEITQLITAKSEAVTVQATAQTELTQANIAIDNAQTAVNNLQATIGTTTNVLAGVDDAGVQMNLPFGMQMGGTVYNNVYVGSNATITFGVNEGPNYYSTPNAPSISIAGWDWTTWSTGTGITYSTTGTSLDIAWDLRPYPQQDASTQMVQIRFNADVNPNDGAWLADVTAVGPIPGGARFNYRETTNGAVTEIIDNNTGSGFAGQISQGATFTPYVDPNTSTVQAEVDAANATITQLNSSLTPVVSQNTINTSAINAINTTSLTNTVNSAVSTKTSLQSTLNTKADQLTTAINNNIPTPAPILAAPIIEGTTITIAPELPTGYTANTWFYQVVSNDTNVLNPYEGQTLNTDGAPESIQLTGLTEGATYIVRVANWSGPVSEYTETMVSIPRSSASLVISPINPLLPEPPSIEPPTEPEEPPVEPEEPPVEEPPVEEPPTEEPPVEEPITEEPIIEEPIIEEPIIEEPITEEPITEEPPVEELPTEEPTVEETTTEEEVDIAVEDAISDGNLSDSDAEEILDALGADGEITADEVNNLADALAEDGKLTNDEKDLIADALIESTDGNAVSSDAIKEAGLSYGDLPPATPVDVRTDENGNAVVITAAVAAQVELLQNPSELLATAFSDPGAALAAFGSIGADMSTGEREEATDMVIATVVAAGAAINAAAVATGGATGGSTGGGGSSGGGSGANSPGSRGGRKW
jgi:hypothetical protein